MIGCLFSIIIDALNNTVYDIELLQSIMDQRDADTSNSTGIKIVTQH